MVGDGNTSTGPARYTQFVEALPGATQTDVTVPNGATGFRIGGGPSGPGSPWLADKSYGLRQAGGGFHDSWNGPEVLTVHNSGDFIPLPGTPDLMRINHPSGDLTCLVVWQLEL